jgi:hypothetical protein
MLFKPAAKVRFAPKVQSELYKKGVRFALDAWVVYKINQDATLILQSSRASKHHYFLTVDANQALFDL